MYGPRLNTSTSGDRRGRKVDQFTIIVMKDIVQEHIVSLFWFWKTKTLDYYHNYHVFKNTRFFSNLIII